MLSIHCTKNGSRFHFPSLVVSRTLKGWKSSKSSSKAFSLKSVTDLYYPRWLHIAPNGPYYPRWPILLPFTIPLSQEHLFVSLAVFFELSVKIVTWQSCCNFSARHRPLVTLLWSLDPRNVLFEPPSNSTHSVITYWTNLAESQRDKKLTYRVNKHAVKITPECWNECGNFLYSILPPHR